jgi:hypothetical protein
VPWFVAEMYGCQWDETTRTLTTAKEAKHEKEVKAFKSASWFKEEFGLLARAAGKEKNYTAPEALYNLAGAGSVKTIHNRHAKSKKVSEKGSKANKKDDKQEKNKKKKEVIELSSGESLGKSSSGESSASESSSSNNSRDSTSQSSSNSNELSSSTKKRSHSKGRQGGKKSATGATRGG